MKLLLKVSLMLFISAAALYAGDDPLEGITSKTNEFIEALTGNFAAAFTGFVIAVALIALQMRKLSAGWAYSIAGGAIGLQSIAHITNWLMG